MTKQTKDVQTVIDELATKGVEALDAMANFTQEQVDHIVHQAAIAALDKHMYLAKLAVDETGRGIYCFPVFCVKIKFYREVCQSKLLAISLWRFIINIHDIRIMTAVFTVQWFNDIR